MNSCFSILYISKQSRLLMGVLSERLMKAYNANPIMDLAKALHSEGLRERDVFRELSGKVPNEALNKLLNYMRDTEVPQIS